MSCENPKAQRREVNIVENLIEHLLEGENKENEASQN